MKKLDNFLNCLTVLKNADFQLADNNEIYRTGVIGQFNLTFELAWKALQELLKMHGVKEADTGSPREIAFPIKRDTEEIWKEKLLRVDCGWEIWEEDSLLPVMQIGEVPLRSCTSPICMVQIVIVCYPVLMQIKKLYLSNTMVKLYFVQFSV